MRVKREEGGVDSHSHLPPWECESYSLLQNWVGSTDSHSHSSFFKVSKHWSGKNPHSTLPLQQINTTLIQLIFCDLNHHYFCYRELLIIEVIKIDLLTY